MKCIDYRILILKIGLLGFSCAVTAGNWLEIFNIWWYEVLRKDVPYYDAYAVVFILMFTAATFVAISLIMATTRVFRQFVTQRRKAAGLLP